MSTAIALVRSVPGVRFAPLLVPALLAILLYAPIFPRLVDEWLTFPNLSHGVAIPIIAGYLLWARRERLAELPLEPSMAGLPLLLAGLAGLVVGVHGHESFVARMSLPVTLLGVTLFTAGPKIFARTWFGIVYLVFMIPLPFTTLKQLTYRSRLFDAEVSTTIVGWLGVPVYREGVMLYLPAIVLEVADECSSIPAIAALLSLGVAYATLSKRTLGSRALLVASALPFAIVSNIIRLVLTIAGVYYIGPVTLQSVFHQFAGTVNFLVTFLLLLMLDSWLGAWERRRRA